MSHVFISYVREDSSLVDRLERDLKLQGIQVWLDRNSIAPGKFWHRAIQEAIQTGAFFLACFSGNSTSRSRTYMNEEITLAIEELRLRPSDRGWFIPVLLSDCAVPPRDIGAGLTLDAIQQVRLYENWGAGIAKIVSAIKAEDLASDGDESEPEDDDSDDPVDAFHESALLRAGENHFHSFDLEGDDEMVAIVEADNYVDMLICAERDYIRWTKRNREDELPAYFDGAEEVRKRTLHLVAPTAGTYGVLVINQGEEDVDVSIEVELR